jgi:RNA polymerase sigma-70 factor (ECF subfamily)
MRDDDADTIARFLAGDGEATRRIDEWIARAATPFRRRLGTDWEDLQQEARIETLRLLRAGSFRGEASLKAYLWRVVGHACLRRVRALARSPQGGLDLEARPSGAPSPLERILAHESASLLLRIFAAMPEGCRELWRLIVAGCGYEEMSERLGVSEGALRVRVLRCRRRATALRLELREGAAPAESRGNAPTAAGPLSHGSG